jgi:hypothetical protein
MQFSTKRTTTKLKAFFSFFCVCSNIQTLTIMYRKLYSYCVVVGWFLLDRQVVRKLAGSLYQL